MNRSFGLAAAGEVSKDYELVQRLNHASDQAEVQIRELLGVETYSGFRQFERTVLDRTRVSQFSAICSKQGYSLRPEQQDQLVQSLIAARSRHVWTTPLRRRDHPITDYAAFFNQTDSDTFLREEEVFDHKFLDDAEAILSPDQLVAFRKFQSSQRSSQLAQITMAARLLAPTPPVR